MKDRRKVLDLFDIQKEYVEKNVSEGIERYRKGLAEIVIKDQNNNVLPNVTVKVIQKTHEFKFGANLFMLDELENDEKNRKYREYFADVFNMATLPFYWDSLEPEKGKPRYDIDSPRVYRRPSTELCMEFCRENGIEPREHALAYEHFFPKWLCGESVAEVKRELERRYAEISKRYADKIRTIEVTNEMIWQVGKTKFYDEPDFVEWCFKLAEKYFPNNQLCINELTDLAWGDNCRATDKYYAYIEANMLKGARIDAVGMQYHLFNRREDEYERTRFTLSPENLYRHMDLYSNFGKPLHITEVTVPSYSWDKEDEEIQADIIEKLYSVWFSHPNVEQIIYWNLVDGYAYVDDPQMINASQGNMLIGENYYHGGLLRFDMSPKPAYNRIKELIQKRWHTEANLVADDKGKCSFRGFYGEYDVEITTADKTVTRTIEISSKSDNKVSVIL